MKKLFILIIFFGFSALTFGANVYFFNDAGCIYTNGQTFASTQAGYSTIPYHLWVDPARYSVDDWCVNIQEPNGNWTGWLHTSTSMGQHNSLNAGTWHIKGCVHVLADAYGGSNYWMYTSFTLYFYVTDNTAPSNPTNLSISIPGLYEHPNITWNANSQEDLSGYQVYRKRDNESWSSIAAVTTNSYIDEDVIGPNLNQKFTYKVTAYDINGNYSGYSNEEFVYGYKINKPNAGTEGDNINQIPDDFSLSQNYPNPFNPSTNITYQIKLKGFVSLKVYDILGKEIANLVNEEKEPGTYSAHFDGVNLSSGLYIYSLKVNEFTAIKKMTLIK